MRDFGVNGNGRDRGRHLVCAAMTTEFLDFTKGRGNDLSTPNPKYRFPGLKPGDRWCLCALRWKEALDARYAPPVVLEASHIKALGLVASEDLRRHAIKVKKGKAKGTH